METSDKVIVWVDGEKHSVSFQGFDRLLHSGGVVFNDKLNGWEVIGQDRVKNAEMEPVVLVLAGLLSGLAAVILFALMSIH